MRSASDKPESREDQLRADAIAIWEAGVAAVKPSRLIPEQFQLATSDHGEPLFHLMTEHSDPLRIALPSDGRLYVFGAGKAGAGMAAAVERVLQSGSFPPERWSGWVNVPEGFEDNLARIRLWPARPLGVNEPTARAVEGTQAMLAATSRLTHHDLGICLISGGGSALLCAPVEGVSLEDKVATTQLLSAAGATIRELNYVRTHLSQVKGGGLASQFRGGTLVTLILSDVIGDPLETIASGPTIPQPRDNARALALLRKFDPELVHVPSGVVQYLSRPAPQVNAQLNAVRHTCLLGNNDRATGASMLEAEARGYRARRLPANPDEGTANEVGVRLAQMLDGLCAAPGKQCLIQGGEPTVQLVREAQRGLGGRNQQLVLAAALERADHASPTTAPFVVLSGGTDGEDGPTDAAGAWINDQRVADLRGAEHKARRFLEQNDAYNFFEPMGGLLKTGPTGTNVCDIRVIVTCGQ